MIHRLIIILLLITMPTITLAHIPVLLSKNPSSKSPQILNRPYNKSLAIYTAFEDFNDIDVYQFDLNESDLKDGSKEILIGTLVPACEPLKNLLVNWVLVGPKQESLSDLPSTEISEKINFNKESGALVVNNLEQGNVWREPYTAHYYFYQKRQKVALAQVGDYRIYVWPSKGAKGDYVFEFGDKEIWNLTDILYTLWVYPMLLLEGEIATKGCTTSNLK